MKYEEAKWHYESGVLGRHYFVDEDMHSCGECRDYHMDGGLCCHYYRRNGYNYGEVKVFNENGTLRGHCLMDGRGYKLAIVIEYDKPASHSEEQLIEIAKEHNLPLLSELPKTEAELTHWNLKWPDCPCLPIESK